MVFAEATLAFPLLASYVYHRAPERAKRRYADRFRQEVPA
jgi:deoxyhypusine synthase